MTKVTADEISKAREVPVIDFIQANSIGFKQESNGPEPYYRLTNHDSLVIKGNKFVWNSQNESGYGAISFAMSYYNLKFPDAVKRVNEHEYLSKTVIQEQSKEKGPFKYPKYLETDNTSKIKEYLINERKIDSRVVDWCIRKDLLAQDKKQNVVFKWKDSKGDVVGADRQGTVYIGTKRGTFKQIMRNSKEDGGFTIDVGQKPDKLAFFESPIDMLSYWSVKKERLQNTRMISMSGLKIETVAAAMKDFKKDGHEIKKIISCVDNDKAGNEFHEKMENLFKKAILSDQRPKQAKDWNDLLKQQKPMKVQQSYGM